MTGKCQTSCPAGLKQINQRGLLTHTLCCCFLKSPTWRQVHKEPLGVAALFSYGMDGGNHVDVFHPGTRKTPARRRQAESFEMCGYTGGRSEVFSVVCLQSIARIFHKRLFTRLCDAARVRLCWSLEQTGNVSEVCLRKTKMWSVCGCLKGRARIRYPQKKKECKCAAVCFLWADLALNPPIKCAADGVFASLLTQSISGSRCTLCKHVGK